MEKRGRRPLFLWFTISFTRACNHSQYPCIYRAPTVTKLLSILPTLFLLPELIQDPTSDDLLKRNYSANLPGFMPGFFVAEKRGHGPLFFLEIF